RALDEQELDLLVSVEVPNALDAASHVGDVARAMRVAARGLIEAALEDGFGGAPRGASVLALQRRGVEQRGGAAFDEALERVERFPQAPIPLRVGDHGQNAAPPEVGEAAIDHRREIDLVELEERRAS